MNDDEAAPSKSKPHCRVWAHKI